ncbi:hypothetical protein LD119_00635 [Mesoplasma sp. JKS002660]|uniref:hypothetical protein n=1 Tax=Mesoplasma whartonense TaxID=2878854 RepID=UPI002022B613|nr:hypothetical protein [Mesoplasma sp. JKS002660]MCL8213702.1 hypothetical protein [Mesoplasma sp. JKS002660]
MSQQEQNANDNLHLQRSKKQNHQNFTGTLIGASISLINAIIQFMMIYWILKAYGTEFNGFIRLSAALTTVGGTTEGALGVSTVVLLMKPLQNNDFITANEIFSTSKKRYSNGMITNTVIIVLLSVLYPLWIVISPVLVKGSGEINFSMVLTQGKVQFMTVPFFELIFIFLFFGVKNIISAGFFGAYENIIQADQQNGTRRVIILFTDLVIYGVLFYLLNITTKGDLPINPIFPFMILLGYGPLRGLLIMIYVKRNYEWLKFYPDFDNFQLKKSSAKMFSISLGRTLLFNTDIFLVMIVLGGYGLRTSSMLSLYLLIGVNTRLIMTNFITSFREYFVSVIVKDGRLYWESYSKYELYLYAVSAFTFVLMSILSPYLVSALYGPMVNKDFESVTTNASQAVLSLNLAALENAYQFMFKGPSFSVIYATSTAFILLIQGQFTLVEAKERSEQVSKPTTIIAILYIVFATALSLIFSVPQTGDYFIRDTLLIFYSTKIVFMAALYGYLWVENWKNGTYNANLHYIIPNLLAFAIPVSLGVVGNLFLFQTLYPIGEMKSLWSLIVVILLVIAGDLVVVIICALSMRPKVAVLLILMLPIVKQIVARTKNESRYKRLTQANVDVAKIGNNNLVYSELSTTIQQEEYDLERMNEIDEVFRPKVYKLKNDEDE